MAEHIRSDFWKCEAGKIHWNGSVQCEDEHPLHGYTVRCRKSRPVTNRELLAHWLLADDDRRREIEIASRPKEVGRYTQYVYMGTPTISSESVIVREYLGNLCFGYIPETAKLPVNKTCGVLWEQL